MNPYTKAWKIFTNKSRSQQIRIWIVFPIILIAIGLFLFFSAREIQESFYPILYVDGQILAIVGLALLASGFLQLLWGYLRGYTINEILSDNPTAIPDQNNTLPALTQQIEELKSQVDSLMIKRSGISSSEKDELLIYLKKNLSDTLTNDFISSIDSKLSEHNQDLYLRSLFSEHRNFLQKEIGELGRRATVNLIIGVFTTLLAVGLLAYMALTSKSVTFNDIKNILEHYLPRLTTVIFIEVFSFFFLKLYRSNLSEIKYYENELTNLTLHLTSVEIARMTPESTTISKLAETFATANRNIAPHSEAQPLSQLKTLANILDGVANTAIKVRKS